MHHRLQWCIILVIFISVYIQLGICDQTVKKKQRTDNIEKIIVCNDMYKIALVHCFCNKSRQVTAMECWVFNSGLPFDDLAWDDLRQVDNVQQLAFNVRSDGALTYLPYKAFKNFKKLVNLKIEYADIEVIQPFAFKPLPNLKEISLHACGIRELQSMAFAEMTMLNNISLINNEITVVKVDIFFALPNLRKLYLSENNITFLASGCFKHLHSLMELHLDDNNLSVLRWDHYQGLTNLLKLNLKGNKIRSLDKSVFSILRNLNELVLDENKIEFISPEAFRGLGQLRGLSLKGNQISAIDGPMFEPLKSLRQLNVANNQIRNIDEETVAFLLQNFNSSYSDLDLNGNILTCDCRLSWLRDLLNEARSPKLHRSLAAFRCLVDNATQSKLDVYSVLTTSSSIIEALNDSEASYKKFLDIPAEFLPCPYETQSAIVDNESSGSVGLFGDFVLVLVLIVVVLRCK